MITDPAATGLLHPAPQRFNLTGSTTPAITLEKVHVRLAPGEVTRPQGYTLTVEAAGVTLVGHDEAGLFYARQTLEQLRAAYPDDVPHLTIEDWPNLLTRGYMLDVSRDRVPRMGTVKELIARLARLKINQLQIYTEHTIAYAGHEAVWRKASPFTFDEIAELEAYCNARFIDLVPCQNLFGHMERWLTTPGYEHLAEAPDGYDTPWGYHADRPNSLHPADPGSFALSADLIDQYAPRSGSKLFNIGCDETFDLGQGKSKARCEREGKANVYLDYLKRLCARVGEHGKTPMFWGDIVLKHPELVPQVPEDAVLLNWNYEGTQSFKGESQRFREAGVRFYVCPGTSSWCTLSGRGQNAVDNLRDAAEAALDSGAEGYLITDWGDHGHWQPFALSWVGLTYGAGVAWSLDRNRDTERLPQAVSLIAADENCDELGTILWDLSNVYLRSEAKFPNQTWWFRYLKSPGDSFEVEPWNALTEEDVKGVIDALDSVAAALVRYEPSNEAAQRLKVEAEWSARVSRWACLRVADLLAGSGKTRYPGSLTDGLPTAKTFDALVEEYRTRWHERYRPGGLDDSVRKLRAAVG